MTDDFKKGVEAALKAIENVQNPGCLCGHGESCSGACMATKEDFIKAIKNLLK